VTIGERNVSQFLGQEEYRSEIARNRPTVGVVTGLAKTFDGGEILFIESVKMKGGGRLRLTGQLGDVMRESAEAAMSFVQSHYLAGAPDKQFFEHYDIHIHVPAGAVPKDGPSAGVAIATTICSLLYNRPARNDVAMTGEITLTGQVLAIGGLKDKVIAAHRAGIKTVLFPDTNKRDLDEIPDIIKKDLKLIPMARAAEAIEKTLVVE
jgi:ATP-dependent Lon protease